MTGTNKIDYIQSNKSDGKIFDKSHGSPYDRGAADSWYDRDINPHYYPNGSYNEPRIEIKDMTKNQIDAYIKGYNDNEAAGGKKVW
jgi:hypothetical protein|tara:strand:+ start:229 stop:486 length:258 start_codon:yes stop_codon:yes gene_type:complete